MVEETSFCPQSSSMPGSVEWLTEIATVWHLLPTTGKDFRMLRIQKWFFALSWCVLAIRATKDYHPHPTSVNLLLEPGQSEPQRIII